MSCFFFHFHFFSLFLFLFPYFFLFPTPSPPLPFLLGPVCVYFITLCGILRVQDSLIKRAWWSDTITNEGSGFCLKIHSTPAPLPISCFCVCLHHCMNGDRVGGLVTRWRDLFFHVGPLVMMQIFVDALKRNGSFPPRCMVPYVVGMIGGWYTKNFRAWRYGRNARKHARISQLMLFPWQCVGALSRRL